MSNKKPIQIYQSPDSIDMMISWTIHNKCNYSCSYCPPSLHRGDATKITIEQAKAFIDRIYDYYTLNLKKEKILFSFSGGEPTLWKGFRELCEYIGEKGYRVSVTSNFSTSTNYWSSIAKCCDAIMVSYHPETADPEKFVRNYQEVSALRDAPTPGARIMMSEKEELWKRCEWVIENIVKTCTDYTIQAVGLVDGYDSEPVPREYPLETQKEFLIKNSFLQKQSGLKNPWYPMFPILNYVKFDDGSQELVNENKLLNDGHCNFKDWSCNVGLEQLYVNDRGEIYGASCRIGGCYGQVSKPEEIEFPSKPVICFQTLCHCASDIRVSTRVTD